MSARSRNVCKTTLPSSSPRRSLNPEASAANEKVADFLVSLVNLEIDLADGVVLYCCKPCFLKLERAEKLLQRDRKRATKPLQVASCLSTALLQ